jgi:hypothetical protein
MVLYLYNNGPSSVDIGGHSLANGGELTFDTALQGTWWVFNHLIAKTGYVTAGPLITTGQLVAKIDNVAVNAAHFTTVCSSFFYKIKDIQTSDDYTFYFDVASNLAKVKNPINDQIYTVGESATGSLQRYRLTLTSSGNPVGTLLASGFGPSSATLTCAVTGYASDTLVLDVSNAHIDIQSIHFSMHANALSAGAGRVVRFLWDRTELDKVPVCAWYNGAKQAQAPTGWVFADGAKFQVEKQNITQTSGQILYFGVQV